MNLGELTVRAKGSEVEFANGNGNLNLPLNQAQQLLHNWDIFHAAVNAAAENASFSKFETQQNREVARKEEQVPFSVKVEGSKIVLNQNGNRITLAIEQCSGLPILLRDAVSLALLTRNQQELTRKEIQELEAKIAELKKKL